MTNEPIVFPVAPHSLESNFLPLDRYRGIVEEAVFDRLGRPSFFEEAVDQVMGRISTRVEGEQTSETANGKSLCAFAPQGDRAGNGESDGKNMRFAPQSSWIRELARLEGSKPEG